MTDVVIIEAVVQVGAHETRYLRCGRGENVVVVLATSEDERLRLMGPLATGHRVIAPSLPSGVQAVQSAGAERDVATAGRAGGSERDLAVAGQPGGSQRDLAAAGRAGDSEHDLAAAAIDAWLLSVLDGLGIERPAVVLALDMLWLSGRISCCEHLAAQDGALSEPC